MRALFFLLIPTLAIAGEYTAYIGDTFPRAVAAIAADAAGNTYVVGNRATAAVPSAIVPAFRVGNFTTATITPLFPSAPNDVFVSKIDPTGKVLFTQAFAGKGVDQGLAVAVDPTGNIYVAGSTTSPDFPISNALQPQAGSSGAGFIVKLSPDGKTILYSTYFGGLLGLTSVNAMTTDASGNLYLTGSTLATDFPVSSGMPSATPSTGIEPGAVAFVAAISALGDKILFSGTFGSYGPVSCPATVFGCPGTTASVAIALDGARNVYFGGNTVGYVPTTPGALVSQGLGAFVGKITANGSGLAYLTYLGKVSELGPVYLVGATQLSSLTVDSSGNTYLAGTTGDPNFPVTTGAYQTTFAGNPVNPFGNPTNTDGFLAKLKPDGSAFLWATYLGGIANDAINSIAVDAAGDVWATGTTNSPNFPNARGWSQGGDFLVEMNPSGSALAYSARYPNGTVSQAVALDGSLLVHTAGISGILSEIASTAPPLPKIFAIGNVIAGPLAGRVSPAEVISIYGPGIGPAAASSSGPASGVYPTALSGVQVTIGGIPAPVLYVSQGQINAIVPMEAAIGAASTVQITNGTITTPSFPVWIDAQDPGVFPAVLNQNASLNTEANPAKLGSTIFFYATGWQASFSPLTDGQVATQANNSVCFGAACATSAGTITYAGAAPGLVAGVTQINLLLNSNSVPVTGLQEVPIFLDSLNAFVLVWVTP